ncbi:hypothetical protein HDU67_006344 [Dinochytrium kinnereticum]|nr:hypothetical protein HDU67_006344 [Dinochytrium kinnereticum]
MSSDGGEAELPLFVIDKIGVPFDQADDTGLRDSPSIVPLAETTHHASPGKPQRPKQRGNRGGKVSLAPPNANKGKGKGKGKGKKGKRKEPRYGFSDDADVRPRLSDDDRDEEELAAFKDYLDNVSDGDLTSVSALASLSLGTGIYLGSDSDSEGTGSGDVLMAETGIFDKLMEIEDELAYKSESDVSTSGSEISDNELKESDAPDNSDIALREDFIAGRSTWNEDPTTLAEIDKFSRILNGKFKTPPPLSKMKRRPKRLSNPGAITFVKSNGDQEMDPELSEALGFFESEEEPEEAVPISVEASKSAMRKARKNERKSERKTKGQQRKALEEEQARIAKTIGKLRAGDAIDSTILRVLHNINRDLRDFALGVGTEDFDEPLASSPLPPMASALRRLVKEMCTHYRILPKVRGSGTRKLLFMVRTGTTRVPDNWKSVVEEVVGRGTNAIVKGNTKMGPRTPFKKNKPPGAPDDRAAPRPGTVVGEFAVPISKENVGHKMLLAMGWTPGATLGASQAGDGAISEPLSVTVRAKRRGLGAE